MGVLSIYVLSIYAFSQAWLPSFFCYALPFVLDRSILKKNAKRCTLEWRDGQLLGIVEKMKKAPQNA